jgi:capsular exopolysaccharide synthesis family protein
VELRAYFQALRKHWLTIVSATVICLMAAVIAYFLTPPVFSSDVTFYVSTPLSAGSNPLNAGQFAQARVNSYVGLLESEQLAQRVIADQNLSLTPSELTRKIDATAQLNTVLVTAQVKDTDQERSLAIARGINNTFGSMVDELDNKGRGADIVIITPVSGPSLTPYPIAPSKVIYGGLGLLAGLGLGALITISREAFDTTVRTEEMTSSLIDGPVIGVIDYDPDSVRSPLLLPGTASGRAESFRQLRTNLQFIDATKSADVLLVTSAVPEEGKSLTSVNLALSFVEFGQSVLLIDADLRRPKIWTYLGVEKEIGLSGVLVGNVRVEEAVQPWGVHGLYVLTSGQLAPNPAELLGSKAMSDLVAKVKTDFDKVIIDTPPLLPVTDAALCSAAADGVVMVVRWGRTSRTQVATAVGALEQVNARLLGGVVNMRRLNRAERREYAAHGYYGA